MKSFLTTLCLMSVVTSAMASTKDVKPSQGLKANSKYVKVIASSDGKSISFKECTVKEFNKKVILKESCKRLGYRDSYTIAELEEREVGRYWNTGFRTAGIVAAGALVGGGAAAVGAFGGLMEIGVGALFGSAAAATASASASVTVYSLAGATVGAGAMLAIVNPYNTYEQGQAIRSDVIHDRNVVDSDMEDYISDLKDALNFE